MQYLLDTVALVRHFTGSGRIGHRASRILDSIEDNSDDLIISVVSLMEVMSLAEKNRIGINLTESLDIIESSSNLYDCESEFRNTQSRRKHRILRTARQADSLYSKMAQCQSDFKRQQIREC